MSHYCHRQKVWRIYRVFKFCSTKSLCLGNRQTELGKCLERNCCNARNAHNLPCILSELCTNCAWIARSELCTNCARIARRELCANCAQKRVRVFTLSNICCFCCFCCFCCRCCFCCCRRRRGRQILTKIWVCLHLPQYQILSKKTYTIISCRQTNVVMEYVIFFLLRTPHNCLK